MHVGIMDIMNGLMVNVENNQKRETVEDFDCWGTEHQTREKYIQQRKQPKAL